MPERRKVVRMVRPVLYIFSRNEEMKNSIFRFVKYVCIGAERIKHEFDTQKNSGTFSFLEEITSFLDQKPLEKLLHTAVIFDISGAEDDKSWDLLRIKPAASDIAATLSLMYPEVYWIFVVMDNKIPSSDLLCLSDHIVNPFDAEGMRKLMELLNQHYYGYSPLFDPSGLRSWLKRKMEKDTKRPAISSDKTGNSSFAAAIDEETSYAFMNAYLAFKMGYKTFTVTTLNMMERLFKHDEDKKNENRRNIDLVFEDLFASFPDKDTYSHLSDIKKKDAEFKGFMKVKKRIFVTVGHKHIAWDKSNKEHISTLKQDGKHIKMIYKPSGGLFNLLEKAGLIKEYWTVTKRQWRDAVPRDEKKDGHSASGKLLLISEKLIDRAEKIYHKAITVKDCIHGAALALEAKNLLMYKTPTTCLEAIALRHKLEVKAECMFYGVEYNIDVQSRFRELEGEIRTISKWFHPKVKKASSLNARMSIVTEIMRIFREFGQFDEEQACLKYFRKLNRKWFFSKNPWMKPVYPLRWYVETLVGSFRYFVIALLVWPILFGFISSMVGAGFGKNDDLIAGFSKQIINSFSIFFGIQPVQFPENPSAMVITMFLMLGGFLHLGIFVSHLYTLITRSK